MIEQKIIYYKYEIGNVQMKLKQKEHVEVVFLVSLTCLLPDSNRWSEQEAWMAAEYATDTGLPGFCCLILSKWSLKTTQYA